MTIYTIGHSNHSIKEFLELLIHHEIELLIDIRRIPLSGRFPHFNKAPFRHSLSQVNIAYEHLESLGGKLQESHIRPDNRGWKDAAYRAYADYMQSSVFHEAAEQCLQLHGGRKTVLMCAERKHRQCHRQLLADYLLSRNIQVLHLERMTPAFEHCLTPFASTKEGLLTYPGHGELF